jgi:rhodanese-related sulfurtransferase
MTLLLVLALTGTLTMSACDGGATDPAGAPNGPTLDAAAFADLTESPNVVVLDVRTPEEYATGHIPDAVNIDVSAPDFASRVGALDTDASYALYCRTGNRSATAMQIMQDGGFASVAHLGGGIVAWVDAGGELAAGA